MVFYIGDSLKFTNLIVPGVCPLQIGCWAHFYKIENFEKTGFFGKKPRFWVKNRFRARIFCGIIEEEHRFYVSSWFFYSFDSENTSKFNLEQK